MPAVRIVAVLVFALLRTGTSAAQQVSSPRVVSLHAPDGTELKGNYFASSKPGPGVLLLHQCNQQRKLWDVLGERLASSGINVLTFDHRGFGESGGTPHDKLTPQGGLSKDPDWQAFPAGSPHPSDWTAAHANSRGPAELRSPNG